MAFLDVVKKSAQKMTEAAGIDLVLENSDHQIAIELKIGLNKTHVRNSLGQLHTYAKHYSKTLLVVLEIGMINSDFYNQFGQDLKNFGVTLLILEGNMRKRRNKTKTATVTFS